MSSFQRTTLDTIEVIPRGKKISLQADATSLAFFLGFTGKAFWYAVRNRDDMYQVFKKPKASGGFRTLHNPNQFMRVIGKQLRRRILTPLCNNLGPHVTAYRTGQSTLDAAKRHMADCVFCAPADAPHTCTFEADGKGHVRKQGVANCSACQPVLPHACPRKGVKIHLDLSDFFGSTRRSWVRKYFHQERAYSHEVSSLLSQLLTVKLEDPATKRVWHGVPQGGKASGDITNVVADWLLDKPMAQMLATQPNKWIYSRYADDLYLTCEQNISYDDVNKFLEDVRRVVRASGYRLNAKKTHVQRPHKQQKLLGVVLNQKLGMPKDEYRRFRAMLHRCWCDGFEIAATRMNKSSGGELQGWIEGKLAYFTNIAPQRARELKAAYAQAQQKFPLGSEMTFTFGKTVTPGE